MVDRKANNPLRQQAAEIAVRFGAVGVLFLTSCAPGSVGQDRTAIHPTVASSGEPSSQGNNSTPELLPIQPLIPGAEAGRGSQPAKVHEILGKEAISRYHRAMRKEMLSARPFSSAYLQEFRDSWVNGYNGVTDIESDNGGKVRVVFYHSSQQPPEDGATAETTYFSSSMPTDRGRVRFVGVQGQLDLAAVSIYGPKIVDLLRFEQALQTERYLRGIAALLGEVGINFVDPIEPQLKAKGLDEVILNRLLNEVDSYANFNAWVVRGVYSTITLREIVDKYDDGTIPLVYSKSSGSKKATQVPVVGGKPYPDAGNFVAGITSLGKGLIMYKDFRQLAGSISSFDKISGWDEYFQKMQDKYQESIRNPRMI